MRWHLLLDRLACGRVEVRGVEEAALSDREWQVFNATGRSLSTRAVAKELGIEMKTVETHQKRIREKLNICDLPELRRAAVSGHTA